MKFTTSLSVATIEALWNVFVAAAPATTETGNPLEPHGIVCGTCAFDGTYCDAGGSYHLCYGQSGCGGASAYPGGCYWDVGNPDYNGQAQC